MTRTLHLTNGSAVIDKIRAVAGRGKVVPWNDVLHEGPVPAGLGVTALRDQRAQFLAAGGAGAWQEIARELEQRDRALEDAVTKCDEIVLWFEHDLYDQLQLIQILDRVPVDGPPAITRVEPPTYLGHLPAEDYPALLAGRLPVTSMHRMAARDAWQAFRAPDPRGLVDVLPRVTTLPHLAPALQRHLEQFPSLENGLSRTEQQAMTAVASGIEDLNELFHHTQQHEEAFFMGDSGFFFHIASLFENRRPLLRKIGERIALTEDGKRLLAGEINRVEFCGIDRWLGGVHLTGHGPVWRWDRSRGQLRFV